MRIPSRILCVDDDPLMLRAVVRALRGAPELIVESVGTPAEARERVLTCEYSVLISDYEMPEQNGIALIESIASRSDVVPVLLTGHSELSVALDAINRGHVYAYIRKPFAVDELVTSVRRAAERFQLGRALHNKIAELELINEALTKRNDELSHARVELENLRDLASTDHKTGVHSYRYFAQRLEEEVARSKRYDLPLSILLLDLDGFKSANDRLGHLGGDAILRAVADILRSGVRMMDVVARFGGDEFAVLLPNTTRVGAAILGERLRAAVAESRLGSAAASDVTISVGIASLPNPDIASDVQLIDHADRALYRAKELGKNRCEQAVAAIVVQSRGRA